MSDRKDNMISFWRIVFTYGVVLFHLFNQYEHWTGWDIGVEFFFVVSGWLLAADLKKYNRTPYGYTLHRIKRLYPEYFMAFIVSAACMIYANKMSVNDTLVWLEGDGIKELLCIHYWPWWDVPYANNASWYVCILLVAGLFLYSLCKRVPGIAKEIIIPIAIIVGLTYSYRTYGSLLTEFYEGIWYHHRFVRGFLEMGIGILLFDFNEKYSIYLKNKAVQIFGFVILLITFIAAYYRKGKIEYLYLLLISIGVAISFNTNLIFQSKILAFFNKISYSIYLNHIIFRSYLMPKFFEALSIKMIILYVVVVTILAILMYYISKYVWKLFGKLFTFVFKN